MNQVHLDCDVRPYLWSDHPCANCGGRCEWDEDAARMLDGDGWICATCMDDYVSAHAEDAAQDAAGRCPMCGCDSSTAHLCCEVCLLQYEKEIVPGRG